MKNSTIVYFICVLGIFSAGLFSGVIQPVFENDKTYITYFIVFSTIIISFIPSIRDWVCDNALTLFLGLLGTVLGFSMAIYGISNENSLAKLEGVNTALNTTIVGLISHIYLLVLRKID